MDNYKAKSLIQALQTFLCDGEWKLKVKNQFKGVHFVCTYHSVATGSNPKHTCSFFNLYSWNCKWYCNYKRTKINEKEDKKIEKNNLILLRGRGHLIVLFLRPQPKRLLQIQIVLSSFLLTFALKPFFFEEKYSISLEGILILSNDCFIRSFWPSR